jgi:hypothetical protein
MDPVRETQIVRDPYRSDKDHCPAISPFTWREEYEEAYTGRELVGDETLESLELCLLLGRGNHTGVGALRCQPVVPTLSHLLYSIKNIFLKSQRFLTVWFAKK